MPYRWLRPSQVLLDPENPRLPDGASSDRDAINSLLDDDAAALIRLARDIAGKQMLNPATPPILIQKGTKYLVLDGNRRFAALKLLRDPTLANQEEHQKAFRRAASLGTPPVTVYTYVAADRAEADSWIFLLHTGENKGVGVKTWNAEQKANYRKRAQKPVDAGTMRSIVIANELEKAYASDAELVDLVRTTRLAKVTNIGRFFSTDVMKRLHLSIENEDVNGVQHRTLHAAHSASQLRAFFFWAFVTIRGNSVDAYKTAKIRRAALDKVPHLIPKLADALDAPCRLAGVLLSTGHGSDARNDHPDHPDLHLANIDASRTSGIESTHDDDTQLSSDTTTRHWSVDGITDRQKGAQHKAESRPERFLFQGLKLPNHNARVQRLLKECRSLDLDTLPGVACVMVRVLVELSVSSPEALALSRAREVDGLDIKLKRMMEYLDNNIERLRKRDPELAQAYFEADNLTIQYLHALVHNPAMNPDPILARRFSSAFRPLLLKIDAALT